MTPASYFLRISNGQDRAGMLDQLAPLGVVHDNLAEGHIYIVISYERDLKAFRELIDGWQAAGRARILQMGG